MIMYELKYKMNLTFFSEGGEKTEEATPRKKEKAREEGQVAKSTEITTSFMIVLMFFALRVLGPFVANKIILNFQTMVNLFSTKEVDIIFATKIFNNAIITLGWCIVPFFTIAFIIAFATNVLQVGFKITFKPLQPKIQNLSPISGFKRIFSLRTIVEFVKSLLKLTIILSIVYFTVRDYDQLFYRFYEITAYEAYATIFKLAIDVGLKIGFFFLIVAVIDYLYQRYALAKKLRMTKQEVKDEYKMTEGNPQIKQKIRQRMREASMRRMMQDLKEADVVITNPTHFAVALKYEEDREIAPVVVAKGADLIAKNIREKSTEYGIEIVEDKSLARTLFYTVEIGDAVPESLYEAVARVLAIVYSINKRKE